MKKTNAALARLAAMNTYVHNEYGHFLYRCPQAGIGSRLMKLGKLTVRYQLLKKPPRGLALNVPPMRGKPCMGAESAVERRAGEVFLAQELMGYDVVSFDVFDTLLLRMVDQPRKVFLFAEKKLAYVGYATVRGQTETALRRAALQAGESGEVTWEAIHREVERRTGIPWEKSAQAEWEAERMLCRANPYMRHVVRMLLEQGKTVIAVSDMYLSETQIRALLEHCGYHGFSRVFVSCDYGVNKRDGALYRVVHEAMGPEKSIMHVGDNQESDVFSARKQGLNARYYQGVNDIGRNFRPDGLSPMVGTVYAGLVNAHLHCGTGIYSPLYEFGYLYGGLYALGFCSWLKEKARQEGVEKLLFLARDGDIYQKVFRLLDPAFPTEYVYWSRSASLRCNARRNRHDFLCRMVWNKAEASHPVSLESLMRYLSLEGLIGQLSTAGLAPDELLTTRNAAAFERFLTDRWEALCAVYDAELAQTAARLKEAIGSAKRVALVDIGWTGIGLLALRAIITDELHAGCDVRCYMSASRSPVEDETVNMLMTRQVEAYMFSQMENHDLYQRHLNGNHGLNAVFMELLCQSDTPSFVGVDAKGDYRFDVPEVENLSAIREINRGTMDFARQYLEVARGDSDLLRIPGRDAYLPFSHLLDSPEFFRRHFSDFRYMKTVGGGILRAETLGEIMTAAGL